MVEIKNLKWSCQPGMSYFDIENHIAILEKSIQELQLKKDHIHISSVRNMLKKMRFYGYTLSDMEIEKALRICKEE